MKAFILAAGLGKRMLPLTKHTPKALLPIQGKPLIEWHLEKIAKTNISQVIINVHHLGDKIMHHLGDGNKFNLEIIYSQESHSLETGGGLKRALHLIEDDPLLVISADIFSDVCYVSLIKRGLQDALVHLILRTGGKDCNLDNERVLSGVGYTYAGISLLHPQIIESYATNDIKFSLGDILRFHLKQNSYISGEIFYGNWYNIGDQKILQQLNK